MDRVVLTTMCAIVNAAKEWLFIDRKKSWCGLALPGGHIRESESVYDCVVREVEEETGLALNTIQFKGISHFFNRAENERYMVFNFSTNSYTGNYKTTCEEGDLFWLKPDEVDISRLSEGMAERFDLFRTHNCLELFAEWDSVIGRIETKKHLLITE
jgi:8-oxo-dGTP diphosphatase